MAMMGMWQMMFLSSFGTLFSMGSFLGLPPAARDANLAKTAPASALVYYEWSEMSGGKKGAAGIDGLIADPEVQHFFQAINQAITNASQETDENLPASFRVMSQTVPFLIMAAVKNPGCLWLEYDEKYEIEAMKNTKKKKENVKDEKKEVGSPFEKAVYGVRGALVLHAKHNEKRISKMIDDLVKLIPEDERTKNLQMQKIPVPDEKLNLVLHRHKNYVILAFGKDVVKKVVEGLDGKSTGLSANKGFTQSVERLKKGKIANVLWLNLGSLAEKAGKMFGPQVSAVVKSLGADAIESFTTCTCVENGNILKRSFLKTGGSTAGILSLFSGKVLHAEDFREIPADCDLVFSYSLNKKKIFQEAGKVVAGTGPQNKKMFDEFVQQLEKELELSLNDDIFNAFDDKLILFNSPSAGGLYITSLTAAISVNDHEKANKVFKRAMKLLADYLPGEMTANYGRKAMFLKSEKFMGRTVHYVNSIGMGGDMFLSPSFCLTDKQLLIAPHPQAIKAQLRFLKNKETDFGSVFESRFASNGGELFSISYLKTKKAVGLLYAFAPYLGQVMFGQMQRTTDNLDLDIFDLPSAKAILSYMGDFKGTLTRTQDGILCETSSVVPVPVGGITVMGMSYWIMFARMRAMGLGAIVPPVRIIRKNAPQPQAMLPAHKKNAVAVASRH